MKVLICCLILNLVVSGYFNVESVCLTTDHKCGEKDLYKCIPQNWVCDHNSDCEDQSDEVNCPAIKCDLNEYKCMNSDNCIKKTQLCDGRADCVDHSDESNCTIFSQKTLCNKLTEYDCLNTLKLECIPLKDVCNENTNCSNGRDKIEDCKKDACVDVNKKPRCSHTCINKYSKFACLCPVGMELDKDQLTCKIIDVCLKNPGICPQACTSTNEGHTCSCYEDFNQIDQACVSKTDEATPKLLYASYGGIYVAELFRNQFKTTIKRRSLLTETDTLATFDAKLSGKNLAIYSSVNGKDNVLSLDLLNKWNPNNKVEVSKRSQNIVSKRFSFSTSYYSVATDPVRNLVFWTNTKNSTISVFNSSSIDRIDIVIKDCYKPIGIAVDSVSGKIFWIDLGIDDKDPRILMANMDGTGQTVIVRSGLRHPTSLALDFDNQHLYWNDQSPGSIQFIDLKSLPNGSSNINVLFEEREFNPYSMAIYKNRIYWSDLHQNRIYSVHKISGKGLETVLAQVMATTIRIISSSTSDDLRRRVNDPKISSGCSEEFNACDFSCLPTQLKNRPKCFGSAHQMKGASKTWLFVIIPIVLLTLGAMIFGSYRSVKARNIPASTNSYARIYVHDSVNFYEDANAVSTNESEEVNISDSIPIIQTV